MVRTKKTDRKVGSHSEDDMRTAIELIKSGLSLRQASKLCLLSYSTVRRYLINSKKNEGKAIRLTPNYAVNRVFNAEEESHLVKYIKKGNDGSSERFSSRDCRRLAYEMARIINKKIPTRWCNDKMASMDWVRAFKDRHKVSLVKRKAGEIMRQIVFDKDDMESFFAHLKIVKEEVRDQPAPAQPLPGPSNAPSTKTSGPGDNASSDQDPLSKGTIEQCRFCGDFSKECISVCNMPYLSTNRTTLAFNDVIVQIDFNDHTLPKTICKDCDAKLQDMFDFVRVVKNAQRSLINVAEQEKVQVNVEVDPSVLETVVVKTEDSDDDGVSSHDGNEDKDDSNEDKDDSNDDDYSDENDENDVSNEEDDNKDGIVDSLTISETVFIKEPVAVKRKNTTSAKTSKKAKVTGDKSEEDSLIIDIKEEVIEKDTNDDNNTGYSDTGTDDKPSEVELATSALVFEMRGDTGFS